MKISKIIRYIVGLLFLFVGIVGISISDFTGVFLMLFGISLFPIIYSKFIKNKLILSIFVPIALFILFGMTLPKIEESNGITENNKSQIHSENSNNEINENKEVEIYKENTTEKSNEEVSGQNEVPVVSKVDDSKQESDKTESKEISTSGNTSGRDKTKLVSNTSTNNVSREVYITKTGKKYHYSSSCVKSPITTTLDNAISSGYGPCKKCVL